MYPTTLLWFGLLLVFVAATMPAGAQETVTIPKARLLELERKEKELDALRVELGKARGETEQLQRAKEKAETDKAKAETKAAAAAVAEPVIAHDTPALASLPPLKRATWWTRWI